MIIICSLALNDNVPIVVGLSTQVTPKQYLK